MEQYNNYLAHHGIKGQKWGIRRFQNPDGTRTPLGKKRERNNEVDHDTLIKSTNAKELYKNRDQLSDRELQDRLNRLRNEDALAQMAGEKKKTQNGQNMAKKVLSKIGEKTAEAIAVAIVGATVTPMIGSLKNGKVIKDAVDTVKTGVDFVSFFMDDWNP